MESSDFVGSQILEKFFYRKTFNGETKVNSLKTKEILIKKKQAPRSLFMRSTFNEEYKELNVNKKFKSVELDVVEEDLQELGPSGKLINKKKLPKYTK